MSRDSRREKSRVELLALESDFERRLVAALESCAAGQWGMFESQPAGPGAPDEAISEGRDLARLGEEIAELRGRQGVVEEYWFHSRLKHYRGMSDGNDPGEPKRARQFLSDIAARKS